AVAALQAVLLPERLLERVQLRRRPQCLDGGDLGAGNLNGEGEAGARSLAIDQDGTHPADPVFAAHMRPGQPEVVPDEVAEQAAQLDSSRVSRHLPPQRELYMLHR